MSGFGAFTEYFRPKNIDDLVLPKRIKDVFKDGNVEQHYLFYSLKPGSGKSTLAKILASSDYYDDMYINVSDESSVDVIRGKIKEFATSASIINNSYVKKIIILDEIHGASQQFYDALLGVSEQFSDDVKFVATCNYLNKIPENVQSRFACIKFSPETDEEEKYIQIGLAKRALDIVKEVGMSIEKDALIELIKVNFPDMRSVVKKINLLYNSGVKKITKEDVTKANYGKDNLQIFELCLKNNSLDIYKKVINKYAGKSTEILHSLGNEFIVWLEENHKSKAERPDIIAGIIKTVNEHSYKQTFVVDRMLNLTSCIFELQNILNN